VEFRQLQSFVAVAEELSFVRAAARLHVAQPWLSQMIKQVEREVGAALLERTTRRVSLTASGEAFLLHARRCLASLGDAGEAARRAARGEAGRLAVGFTGAATHRLLPAVARAHRAQFPLVQLELVGPAFTREQVAALLDRRIDVGLIRLLPATPELTAPVHTAVLGNDPLVALLPDGHPYATGSGPVDPAVLRHEPFVAFPEARGAALNDVLRAVCAGSGFTPHVGFEVADSSVLVALVAAGFGVALLPRSFLDLSSGGVVARTLTYAVDVPIALAWRTDQPVATVGPFVAVARAVAQASTRSGTGGDPSGAADSVATASE